MAITFNYQEYLASREWALLKNQVRERSGGICERCHQAPHQSTHHLTYERIGHEMLTDLLGVCNPCHEYLSGKSNDDPSEIVAEAPKTIIADPGIYIHVPRGDDAAVLVRLIDEVVWVLRSHIESDEKDQWSVFFVLPTREKFLYVQAIDFKVHVCASVWEELTSLLGESHIMLVRKGDVTRKDQRWEIGAPLHKSGDGRRRDPSEPAIAERWSDVIAAVAETNPILSSFLSVIRPIRAEDGALLVEVATEYQATTLAREHHKRILRHVMQRVYGLSLEVKPQLVLRR